MKFFRRFLSAFVCCLLLSVEFLGVVSAADSPDIWLSGDTDYLNGGVATIGDNDVGYVIKHHAEGIGLNGAIKALNTVTMWPGNGNVEKATGTFDSFFTSVHVDPTNTNMGGSIHAVFTLYKDDGSVLIRKGGGGKIWLDNLYHSYWFDCNDEYGRYIRGAIDWKACIIYLDGTSEYTDFEFHWDGPLAFIRADIGNASQDIKCVEFHLYTDEVVRAKNNSSYAYWDVDYYLGEYSGDDSYNAGMDEVDQSTGLLSSLIEWVKSIRQGVTQIFETLSSGFGAVVNGITSLPRLIWEKIETGLKNLFVPDEQYISDYMVDMDALLDEKFGAVYQVIDVTLESWDRISANDEQNTIDFPETTIALPDDNEFTFGGYEVPIVPDGFEWLATALKGFVGVVCTVMFVNGLRKRYDEVMGGGA